MEKLTEEEIYKRVDKLVGWEYRNNVIESYYEFKNFKEAFAIMTRIAFECEAQNHHPDWTNIYNSLHIRLNTHTAQGVTEKDFILAKSIDAIISKA
ncbi:4a-hydroxytetrahydrobiopterin dehydratase [Saonia flava]|uniref:Putative pterin-4-alpha-carbinolamine dehydratase n=1 Tax=Saonia flava TaxID=523696 RepID=A0A846QN22_9FLAO|nr:4a-hydroxytetrahydrobiopterin dehydratase [Saonia flava]NJB70426.1 4a-hydroxytetrahydrobiopterin dehydratase [Saonia flava]